MNHAPPYNSLGKSTVKSLSNPPVLQVKYVGIKCHLCGTYKWQNLPEPIKASLHYAPHDILGNELYTA